MTFIKQLNLPQRKKSEKGCAEATLKIDIVVEHMFQLKLLINYTHENVSVGKNFLLPKKEIWSIFVVDNLLRFNCLIFMSENFLWLQLKWGKIVNGN